MRLRSGLTALLLGAYPVGYIRLLRLQMNREVRMWCSSLLVPWLMPEETILQVMIPFLGPMTKLLCLVMLLVLPQALRLPVSSVAGLVSTGHRTPVTPLPVLR